MNILQAIREIKEGQEAIAPRPNLGDIHFLRWEHGGKLSWGAGARDFNPAVGWAIDIIDLPKPKTLREVVVEIGGGSCRTCAWERQSCEKDVNKSCYNGHWLTLEKALASAGVDLEQIAKEAK